ncbi:asparagine synthetase [glutamine-hydrolyzing] [Biomphalaria glabrata]|nr:asparagine synthetase [glutamine-hydrolyzing] [Biomphalaria glabrata]
MALNKNSNQLSLIVIYCPMKSCGDQRKHSVTVFPQSQGLGIKLYRITAMSRSTRMTWPKQPLCTHITPLRLLRLSTIDAFLRSTMHTSHPGYPTFGCLSGLETPLTLQPGH